MHAGQEVTSDDPDQHPACLPSRGLEWPSCDLCGQGPSTGCLSAAVPLCQLMGDPLSPGVKYPVSRGHGLLGGTAFWEGTCHSLIIYSPTNGHLDSFQLWGVVSQLL